MPICPHCEREIDVPEIVEIDPNAKFPHCPVTFEPDLSPAIMEYRQHAIKLYHLTQRIMYKAGWRKVL